MNEKQCLKTEVQTMAELIEREAVLPILAGLARTQGEYNESYDKLMQIPSANRWIPCSERLPEIDIDVIVFYPYWNDKPIQVAHLAYDELTFELSDGEFNFPTRSVTHWMPLPSVEGLT
jgi:hypothetical protein